MSQKPHRPAAAAAAVAPAPAPNSAPNLAPNLAAAKDGAAVASKHRPPAGLKRLLPAAAKRLLAQPKSQPQPGGPVSAGHGVPLRVVTWNIRKAMGTDRRRDPDRILHILAQIGADVVLLQEADFRLPPRRPIFHPAEISARSGLSVLRLPHAKDSLGWHGNVILTAASVTQISGRGHDLPGLEPRGTIEALLAKGGRPFRAFGVHLGLLRHSRRGQLSAMLGILGQDPAPTLIAGDFNERSQNVGLGRLAPRFRILAGGPTYHARVPLFALDRIAISPGLDLGLELGSLRVFHSAEASLASDHLPLIADLQLSLPAAKQTR